MTESFGSWLKNQTWQDGPVGDLARDFKASRSKASTPSGVRASIEKYIDLQDDDPVARALDEAIRQWPGK